MKNVFKSVPKPTPRQLSYLLIIFGITVRVIQYLYDRSLWLDEAKLALNIIERSYLDLLQPLDYDQGAPLLFLLLTKLLVQIFGDNEYSLRLIPLFSGIFSFILFYKLAKLYIEGYGVPIAISLFASLHYLVYYSFEFKQYATDVLIALFLVIAIIPWSWHRLNQKQILTYSLIGSIAIWSSHTAVFVLAGISLTALMSNQKPRDIKLWRNLIIIGVTWLISFIIFYLTSLSYLTEKENLLSSWQEGFVSSIFDVVYIFGRFIYEPLGIIHPLEIFNIFKDLDNPSYFEWTIGISIILTTFFIIILGCISLYNHNKKALLLFISPILFTLLASYLQKFPFRGRLVLFLTPFIILLIAEGFYWYFSQLKFRFSTIIGLVLLTILVILPFIHSSRLLFNPYLRSEIEPVLSYIQKNQKPNDVLYIHQKGVNQFKYYAKKYGYSEEDYILGVDDLGDGESITEVEQQRYEKDLDKLRGYARVWVLFSHSTNEEENEMFKDYLDSLGKEKDHFSQPLSFVYLYDLR